MSLEKKIKQLQGIIYVNKVDVLKLLGVVADKVRSEITVCENMMSRIKKQIAELNIEKGDADKVAKLLVDYHTFEVMHAISKQHLARLVEKEENP